MRFAKEAGFEATIARRHVPQSLALAFMSNALPFRMQEDMIDEAAGLDTVPNTKAEHKVDVAISNSFGFGGHNSVVVFAPFTGN